MSIQILTLQLDGITASDYLQWCRDPDPPALDYGLRSISIDAEPLGDTITATLDWDRPAPPTRAAATAAGLPVTGDVQAIRSEDASTGGLRKRRRAPSNGARPRPGTTTARRPLAKRA
jgi:hypothetical protein